MNDFLMGVFNVINGFLWSYFMIIVLVGTGLYFTFRLRFVQVRRFGQAFKSTFGGIKLFGEKASSGGMSSFQALATALAGQIGAGNIAGPATAIMAGGPGAIFWMWVASFFGMGTMFAEATAAQKYRKVLPSGTIVGGPATYIQAAFPNQFGKILSVFFSIFIIIGYGMAAGMIQGNTIAGAFKSAFGLNPLVTGGLVCILLLIIVIGGARRIASSMEKLVPLMAAIYMIGGLIVIFAHFGAFLEGLKLIVECAFNPAAAGGGFVGLAVKDALRYGIARGLFTNEAGMGTTPQAHAMAQVNHPCDQGLAAMMGVFIDTFLVLPITVFVIMSTGVLHSGLNGVEMVQAGFDVQYGPAGNVFIAICLFLFAFATVVAAYFYGQINFINLFGEKTNNLYTILIVAFIMFGAYSEVALVWGICDTFNALMVIVNLFGLLGVSGVIIKLSKEYDQMQKKISPIQQK